jgi:hypothetical protein
MLRSIVLPFCGVDKVGCWVAKRLGEPHREAHADGEFCDAKVGELIGGAVQTFGHLLPGDFSPLAGGIQGFMEPVQVPAQAMRLIRRRERYAGSAELGLSDKVFGRNIQPAQQEQRVLATHVTALADPADGCRADGVVIAAGVQHAGLIPDCLGQSRPAQMALEPLRVYGSEKRRDVETLG